MSDDKYSLGCVKVENLSQKAVKVAPALPQSQQAGRPQQVEKSTGPTV